MTTARSATGPTPTSASPICDHRHSTSPPPIWLPSPSPSSSSPAAPATPSLRAVAHRVAAALPDARLIELADCGHVTYAEQPEAFAHAVSTFAAELDRRPATASS